MSRLPFLFSSASSNAVAHVRCTTQTCHRTMNVGQWLAKNFWIFEHFETLVPISQQRLQLEAYDPSHENIPVPPYPPVASISAYLPQRSTGWVKKLVTQYQFCALRTHIAHEVLQGGPKSKWCNASFEDYEPSTVFAYVGRRRTHILA